MHAQQRKLQEEKIREKPQVVPWRKDIAFLSSGDAAAIPGGTLNAEDAHYLLPRVQQHLIPLQVVADGFLDVLCSHVSKQSW